MSKKRAMLTQNCLLCCLCCVGSAGAQADVYMPDWRPDAFTSLDEALILLIGQRHSSVMNILSIQFFELLL